MVRAMMSAPRPTPIPATPARPGGLRLVLLALTGLMAAGPAAAAEFVSHQALYRVSLASAEPKSGVASARGAVLYRFADACDGWTVENRTLLRLGFGEAEETETEWSHVSWESKDGLAFRFHVRDIREDELTEELQGQATLSRTGGPGRARFVLPEDAEVALPAGTLFPTHHLMALLDGAQNGRRYDSAVLFDGASLDNPYTVGTVISEPSPDARDRLGKRPGLDPATLWSLRMAFFPVAGGESTPKFEVGVALRADGIADAIVQDFGDFVLLLTLQDLDLLPPPDC